MDNAIDLKALERKAYRSTFQDGLLDLVLGMIFFIGGLGPLLPFIGIPRHWISLAILAVPVLFFLGKKYITVPRMGKVKFSASRRADKKKLLLIIILFQALTWIIYLLAVSHHFPGDAMPGMSLYVQRLLTATLLLFLPFSLMAYFLDIPRLYLLAIMASLGESVYDYLHTPWKGLLTMGITGTVFLVIGVILLLRFVRRNPIADQGE